MHLSERLRTHRLSLGYTQAAYGMMLGLSSDRISSLKCGHWPWRMPRHMQRRFAQVLGCAVGELGVVPRPRKRAQRGAPAPDEVQVLGAGLMQRRRQLGMTQQELADLLGLNRTAICRWERNRVRPSKRMRARLARALGCHVDDLATPYFPDVVGQEARVC